MHPYIAYFNSVRRGRLRYKQINIHNKQREREEIKCNIRFIYVSRHSKLLTKRAVNCPIYVEGLDLVLQMGRYLHM